MNYIEIPLGYHITEARSGAFDYCKISNSTPDFDILHRLVGVMIREISHSDTCKLELQIPASWWQMLKQQHAPAWFLRRFPVKSITVSREFLFDIETIAFANYEYVKQAAAHTPFIRLVKKNDTGTIFRDATGLVSDSFTDVYKSV